MRILSAFLFLAMLFATCGQARADFVQGFESVPGLAGDGWAFQNNSTPIGNQWFQGSVTPFSAQSGPNNSYAGANFQAIASGPGTISSWMITPVDMLINGSTFSFWTRTVTPAATVFPDRLQVRMSLNGASANVGTSATDVGDFTNLLFDINPTYTTTGFPVVWQQYTATITGLGAPTSGRFAFRYFVENGGTGGVNSDFIGVDSVAYTQVPEPTSAMVLAVTGLGACMIRRRRV